MNYYNDLKNNLESAIKLRGFSGNEKTDIADALDLVSYVIDSGDTTLLDDQDKRVISSAKKAIDRRNKEAGPKSKRVDVPSSATGPNIENILNTYSIVGLSQALMVSAERMSLNNVHSQSRARVEEILNNYDENTIGEALSKKYNQVTKARNDILNKVKNHGSLAMIKQQMPKLDSLDQNVKKLLVTLFKAAESRKKEIEMKFLTTPFRFFDPTYKKRIYSIYKGYSDLVREKLFDLVSIVINQKGQNLQNYRVKAEDFMTSLNEFITKASDDLDKMASSNHPVTDDFINSAYEFVVKGKRDEEEPIEEEDEPLSVDSFREKIQSTLRGAFRSR